MSTPALPASLRTELLVTFAILAAAALLVATVGVMVVMGMADERDAVPYLCALIAADVAVFVAFGAYQLRRLVTAPLQDAIEATEAIASGDLARRVPAGRSREFAVLAASINRMTDHLLAEQAHRVRAEKLASVGRLASGLAHEIGNPLGAVHGYAHLLRARVAGDARALDALAGVERESARIDRIVRGLLDYARPRRLTPTRLDLNDALRAVVGLLTDQGRLRGVDVTLSLDPASPTLFGERHELEQLFVNLLLNAADAIDGAVDGGASGGGRIAIHTRRLPHVALREGLARRAGDPARTIMPREPSPRVAEWLQRVRPSTEVVKVVIGDSGPGVPAESAERIFDPFYTTKEPGKGTGLGLAIVARTVENLQGTIWVQRAREGGAAFHVLFPIATDRATAGRPIAPARAAVGAS